MKPLDRAWHQANPMPVRPSRAQRVAWHVEHKRVCGCREVPESLKQEVEAGLRSAEQRRGPATRKGAPGGSPGVDGDSTNENGNET